MKHIVIRWDPESDPDPMDVPIWSGPVHWYGLIKNRIDWACFEAKVVALLSEQITEEEDERILEMVRARVAAL